MKRKMNDYIKEAAVAVIGTGLLVSTFGCVSSGMAAGKLKDSGSVNYEMKRYDASEYTQRIQTAPPDDNQSGIFMEAIGNGASVSGKNLKVAGETRIIKRAVGENASASAEDEFAAGEESRVTAKDIVVDGSSKNTVIMNEDGTVSQVYDPAAEADAQVQIAKAGGDPSGLLGGAGSAGVLGTSFKRGDLAAGKVHLGTPSRDVLAQHTPLIDAKKFLAHKGTVNFRNVSVENAPVGKWAMPHMAPYKLKEEGGTDASLTYNELTAGVRLPRGLVVACNPFPTARNLAFTSGYILVDDPTLLARSYKDWLALGNPQILLGYDKNLDAFLLGFEFYTVAQKIWIETDLQPTVLRAEHYRHLNINFDKVKKIQNGELKVRPRIVKPEPIVGKVVPMKSDAEKADAKKQKVVGAPEKVQSKNLNLTATDIPWAAPQGQK